MTRHTDYVSGREISGRPRSGSLMPVGILLLAILRLGALCPRGGRAALHPAGAKHDRPHDGGGLAAAVGLAAGHAEDDASRACSSRWWAASYWRCCSACPASSNIRCIPFAVVLQVTPVIAVAPLLLIYLPQDVAVLACAWIVAFFPDSVEHHAGPAIRRSQSARIVRSLWDARRRRSLTHSASGQGPCGSCAGPQRCRLSWLACG